MSIACQLRKADPDRYLSVLYAPKNRRDDLFMLYAFCAEIFSVFHRTETVFAAEVRFCWWLDLFEKSASLESAGYPLADFMKMTVCRNRLPFQSFQTFFDAYIQYLYAGSFQRLEDFEHYCDDTEGTIMRLAGLVLSQEESCGRENFFLYGARLRGIILLLRSLANARIKGRCMIPLDLLERSGFSLSSFLSRQVEPRMEEQLTSTLFSLAEGYYSDFLISASRIPLRLRSVFLPVAPFPAYLEALSRNSLQGMMCAPFNISPWSRNVLLLKKALWGWS